MNELINWLLGTALSQWFNGTTWAWPTAEILHFCGLCILLGAILIVDLRLAGFFRSISISATHKLIPLAVFGFFINLVTGILFVFGDPARYFANIGFRIKLVLLLIAGLNALWFYWKINPVMGSWGANDEPPLLAKIIAFISIGSWFGVLLCGRLIPYVGTG